MSKKKQQVKAKSKESKPVSNTQKVSLSINYDKNMNKGEEFKARILERIVVRILGALENRRP